MTASILVGPLERNTRSIGGPTVVGLPGEGAIRFHGWGHYTFGPDFDSRRAFYAAHGDDALGLACQHFGCDPGDLRYFGFGW